MYVYTDVLDLFKPRLIFARMNGPNGSDLRSVEVLGFKVVCKFSVGLSNSDFASCVDSEVSVVFLSVADGVIAFVVFIPSEGLGWFALPAAPNKSVGNFY